MLALENGQVQGWSDHPAGGYQGSFQAIHTPGDYVAAFATDLDNHYLFTGTTIGYVKVWLMTNYLRNEEVSLAYTDTASMNMYPQPFNVSKLLVKESIIMKILALCQSNF